MPKRRVAKKPARLSKLPASPLSPAEWNDLVLLLELSPRQASVVDMLLRGLKDKQIAAELGIGFSTLRTYLDRIFISLNVPDRVGLVLYIFALHNSRNGHAKHS